MSSQAESGHKEGRIRVGLAGWSYADWSGVVYPTRRGSDFHEAAYLAQYFDTIEINTSFYQPLRPETSRRWIERVAFNPNFLFTAKLWQRFTHESGATAADKRACRAGIEPLAEAGRLGALLMQFPFSFHNTPENRKRLETLIRHFGAYPLAVEVRHSTWNNRDFFHLLHERGVGFCNIDQPVIGRSMKPSERATAPVGYIRLHGRRYDTWFSDDPATPPEQRYNYLYSAAELEPWAERARHISAHTRNTFVITNNHFQGKAVVNALELIHLLTRAKVDVPEPLRHHYPELNKIASEPEREPTLFPEA